VTCCPSPIDFLSHSILFSCFLSSIYNMSCGASSTDVVRASRSSSRRRRVARRGFRHAGMQIDMQGSLELRSLFPFVSRPRAYIIHVIGTRWIKQWTPISYLSLSTLNLIPFTIEQLGKNPSAPTRRDYELRSRGLAVLGAEVLDIIQKGAAHLAYSRIKEKKGQLNIVNYFGTCLQIFSLAWNWLILGYKKNLAWNTCFSYYFSLRYSIFYLITGQELWHSCPIGATLLSENMKTRYHREQHPEK